MIPKLIKTLPHAHGEVWKVGTRHVLVLRGQEESYVCARNVHSRSEQDWLTDELEKIAKKAGLWLRTSPSIDVMMIVVRDADIPTYLQACADHFSEAHDDEPKPSM